MSLYYQDDWVTLYHGDCLEQTQWLEADVLVTDPPYGMNAALTRTAIDVPIANDHNTDIRDTALNLWGKKGAIVFGHWRKPRPTNLTHMAIWNKGNQALGAPSSPFATSHEEIYLLGTETNWNGGRDQTVLNYRVPLGDARPDHPTPKPISLMEYLVSKTNGVIADPFAGSGSTLVAARNLGRKVIGVELEEKYCELIAKRLSQQVMDFSSLISQQEKETYTQESLI